MSSATLARRVAYAETVVDRRTARPPRWSSPGDLATHLGIQLDPWQAAALSTTARNVLLLASRQAGKSTTAAIMALHQAVSVPGSLVLIVSPGERQSKLLLRQIVRHYGALRGVVPAVNEGKLALELQNGSEVYALPGSEATIRGFASVNLIVVDEAARVDDPLYYAVRPMLAVSGGRIVLLSTPFGKRGFLWEEWSQGGDDWHRAKVTAHEVPRIPREWLDRERQRIGDFWFDQEFLCRFLDAVDAVFASDQIAAALDPDILPLFGGDATDDLDDDDIDDEETPAWAHAALGNIPAL